MTDAESGAMLLEDEGKVSDEIHNKRTIAQHNKRRRVSDEALNNYKKRFTS